MSEESRELAAARAKIVAAVRALPRRRGLPRGRDADPAAALRRRLRRAVRHALERARRRPLPADRGRALPQAADRRRARAGLRARARTSATRASRTSTRPSSRMVEWYEAYADYRDTMERTEELVAAGAREAAGSTKVTFRGHEIDLTPPWRAASSFVEALEEHGRLDARRGRAARRSSRSAAWTPSATARWSQLVDHALLALRRAGADPADDPPRLPGRALAVRAHDRRRPVARRALRVLRRRDGARRTRSAS